MRLLAMLAATLALVGCEKPKPDPAPAPKAAPAVKTAWSLSIVDFGLAMIHTAEGGYDLRIYCTDTGRMGAQAFTFTPIESEERFSLGGGGEAHVLVAQPQSRGVIADGPIDDALIATLTSGQPISASYGAQTLGPLEAPPEDLRKTFAANCRQRAFEAAAKG